jgi:hypothetical protein
MRSKTWFRPLGFAALALAACTAPPVQAPSTTVTQSTPIRVPQSPQNKVDILFMVDNSASMAAMQEELKSKFNDFFTVFTTLAAANTYADLHIGVVTSDYGAGDQDNTSSGCGKSPGGDLGKLQAVGKQAEASCVAPTGAPYIEYAFGAGGTATGNLPGGNTPANLVTTFTCMASGIDVAGANPGCGFEHQLESVYAALHNTTDNAGFLRPDALLTVVFVTNEDDGSAEPTSHIYESGPAAAATYGQYNTYRQTHWAVTCNNAQAPYSAMANLMDCEGSPNTMNNPGLAYDVSRYINYFTASSVNGGVKADPNDVILVAIDAPASPFSTILAQIGTGSGAAPTPAYVTCGALNPGTCDVHLQHSCQNMVQPGFFGDPPIRLNTVVNSGKYHQIANICGDDLTMTPDYTQALQNLGTLISSNIGQGCIPQKVLNPAKPDCAVNEVTPVACAPGATNCSPNTLTAIPNCADDGGTKPCWMAEMKPQCASTAIGGSPDNIGITVEYASADGGVPTGSYLDVQCNTIASGGN